MSDIKNKVEEINAEHREQRAVAMEIDRLVKAYARSRYYEFRTLLGRDVTAAYQEVQRSLEGITSNASTSALTLLMNSEIAQTRRTGGPRE